MRFGLKVAILKTGKTQRQIALDAHLPEGRLSELVRGKKEVSTGGAATQILSVMTFQFREGP